MGGSVMQISRVSYTVTAEMVNPCGPLWWWWGEGVVLRNRLGVAWRRGRCSGTQVHQILYVK